MKTVHKILIFTIVTLIHTMPLFALPQNSVYNFNMVKISHNHDTYHVDESVLGHRIPPRPISCTISNDGIIIPDVDTSEIISFEIYAIDGSCISTLIDSESFISTLYHLNGEYEIRLITDTYIFKGYIYL